MYIVGSIKHGSGACVHWAKVDAWCHMVHGDMGQSPWPHQCGHTTRPSKDNADVSAEPAAATYPLRLCVSGGWHRELAWVTG